MTGDPALSCVNEQRRQKVRASPLYGLASVEVRDPHTLVVTFLGKAPHRRRHRRHHQEDGYELTAANVRIRGGRRIRDIRVTALRVVHTDPEEQDDWMEVTIDKEGDFSTYTLEVLGLDEHGRPTGAPPENFDPRYSCLPVRFRVDCPSPFDCQPGTACAPAATPAPAVEINYLAKDYASFRQLTLDRLALIMPGWTERHVPDLLITLVELLAFVGDDLSYYQDAVATEAYLRTARQRISVRRHARLVDYHVHDGCNARTWVRVETSADVTLQRAGVQFITTPDASLPAAGAVLTQPQLANVAADAYETFEPVALIPEDVPEPFRPQDVLNWPQFLGQLKNPNDQVSLYLLGQFESHTQELLQEYPADTPPSEALRHAVLEELNRALSDPFLYDKDRFGGRLTTETQDLAKQNPTGNERRRLNRWLLEDAYRDPDGDPAGNASTVGDSLVAARRLYLFNAHNRISFYTWGDTECCLSRGATAATLMDAWADAASASPTPPAHEQQPPAPACRPRKLRLRVGDMLVLSEWKGPTTGAEADADPKRRQAVRLTRVTPGLDPLYDQPVVEIAWDLADALTFPLCLSALVPAQQCHLVCNISGAWGNVVLADHGRAVAPQPLPQVEPAPLATTCTGEGRPMAAPPQPGYYRPTLSQGPVTCGQPFSADAGTQPASALLPQDPRAALPQIRLVEKPSGAVWLPQFDLLTSGPHDRYFVAEMDNDGLAHLRFGDGQLGQALRPGSEFTAYYRVGNGTAGNIGADAIAYVVLRIEAPSGLVLLPTNPLPATGGTDPEPLDQVRELAPHAHQQQLERAITADDYAAIAQRHPRVARAAATLRWTGSWHQVIIVIEPRGGVDAGPALLRDVARFLEPYRRISHEVVTEPVRAVPLDVTLTVWVSPDYLRGHVEAALREVFSNRTLPDGRRGFFHPDNFALGQNVYHSQLVAVAQGVEGVEAVKVTIKRHSVEPAETPFDTSDVLTIGPLEVARCDNDPNEPENGTLTFDMRGGR